MENETKDEILMSFGSLEAQKETVCAIKTFEKIVDDRDQAIEKAVDSLARYKGAMFGYWYGIYVHLNQMLHGTPAFLKDSPFKPFVDLAREIREE